MVFSHHGWDTFKQSSLTFGCQVCWQNWKHAQITASICHNILQRKQSTKTFRVLSILTYLLELKNGVNLNRITGIAIFTPSLYHRPITQHFFNHIFWHILQFYAAKIMISDSERTFTGSTASAVEVCFNFMFFLYIYLFYFCAFPSQ